jgi:uncharacterized integral membrane protein (TIGR00697 family)
VRLISWIAVGLIAYSFLAAYAAISLAPASFWVDINAGMGVPDIQKAYAILFGQGMWTICGSIIAFLVGQLIDVVIFHRILRVTGERFVWLRATASTAVSQLLDSFIVLYIAFVIGPQHWSIPQFLAVGTVNYCYKMAAAIALIPLLYLARKPSALPRRSGVDAAARGSRKSLAVLKVVSRATSPAVKHVYISRLWNRTLLSGILAVAPWTSMRVWRNLGKTRRPGASDSGASSGEEKCGMERRLPSRAADARSLCLAALFPMFASAQAIPIVPGTSRPVQRLEHQWELLR